MITGLSTVEIREQFRLRSAWCCVCGMAIIGNDGCVTEDRKVTCGVCYTNYGGVLCDECDAVRDKEDVAECSCCGMIVCDRCQSTHHEWVRVD